MNNLSGITNGLKTRFGKGHKLGMFGKKHSEETKLKISLFQKGKTRIPHTQETKDKISNSLKGIKHSEDRRKNESLAHIGLKCPTISGENSVFWKGGITSINKQIKNSTEYKLWRKAVFMRDNWTCRECGKKGGEIHPHHIKQFSLYIELRFKIDNGLTLCKECHKKTKTYGNKKNERHETNSV